MQTHDRLKVALGVRKQAYTKLSESLKNIPTTAANPFPNSSVLFYNKKLHRLVALGPTHVPFCTLHQDTFCPSFNLIKHA